jgi:nucleoside-diphosphate-sugar epimerase
MDKGLIAVTGATGFFGGHLVGRLVEDGYRVAAFARSEDKAKLLEGRAEKIVVADITDSEAMARLVDGADTVIHLVSNFRTASGPPESYHEVNVAGTQNVLDAVQSAGVRRLVHCSTIGVHGNVRSTPANEESPFNPGDLYQETKLEAENLVRAAIGTSAAEIVILRPCSIYGPGDMRMLKMFRMLAKGTFFTVGPCLENFHAVYIDDLLDGVVKLVETTGIAGETFILGGESYVTLKDYIAKAAAAVGVRPPRLRFPYGLFYAAAMACEAICVPLRLEPPLHRRRVRFFRNNRAFSIEKAQKVLAYQPEIGLEEGMRRTVAWYRGKGLL